MSAKTLRELCAILRAQIPELRTHPTIAIKAAIHKGSRRSIRADRIYDSALTGDETNHINNTLIPSRLQRSTRLRRRQKNQ